jgi:tetratricopeptide (TPR) repeat protein
VRLSAALSLLFVALLPPPAVASAKDAMPMPSLAQDEEGQALARAHFGRGSELYLSGRHEQAIAEFEIARRYHRSPVFDYDIGRCLEALGRRAEAIVAYERFRNAPGVIDTGDVDARLSALRARASQRPYLGPGLLLGGALALGVASASVYASAAADFDAHVGTPGCMPCSDEIIASIERRQVASQVLLGVAIGVSFADVIWFGVVAQRRRAARDAR